MRIPKYWKLGNFEGIGPQGSRINYQAWGWSDHSPDDALKNGNERAYKAFRKHLHPSKDQQYEYADLPIKEEIIDIIKGDDEIARITRNRYGALVINTSRVLFVDIDLPKSSSYIADERGGLKYWLFPSYRRQVNEAWQQALQKARESREEKAIAAIVSWAMQNPKRSFRMYQTKAGFRLLFTDQLYDPEHELTQQTFTDLNTDPLYVLLTRKQQCFRARLTPKPWRMDMHPLSIKHPTTRMYYPKGFEQWISEYTKRSQSFAVCQWLRDFGSQPSSNMHLDKVIQIHDQYCCSPNLPLA